MYPSIDHLSELLLAENYIAAHDDEAAKKAAGGDAGEYVEYLLREELLSKALLGQAIAESLDLSYSDLERTPPGKASSEAISENDARRYRIVLVSENNGGLHIATDSPDGLERHLQRLFNRKDITISYALPEFIESSFSLYERPLEDRLSGIIKSGTRVAPDIIDEIIKDGLTYHASDIHIEPGPDVVIVRFRIDGSLREVGRLPIALFENILNRIKVESGMRIDEHYYAQDGSIRLEFDKVAVDLRVSLVPTIRGEKVVMRVLGSYARGFNLSDLGLSEANRHKFEEAALRPFGMILTVGPTGSGKTTSLYALLKLLNRPSVNITTIEDPVEYQMVGVNQIQVRRTSDLDFANGLRAIVRQDPDIILVGEIRDRETAEISVNAALTGHLLLSTFHANNAGSAIPRLIDMGIEPFLLSSTLDVILAQRLLRKICPQCKTVVSVTEAIAALPEPLHYLQDYFSEHDSLYSGKGCTACGGSGYQGRTALYEMITVTPAMQELITKNPTAGDIASLARAEGTVTMFEDGLEKVRGGVTTLSEVARIVEPPRRKDAPAKTSATAKKTASASASAEPPKKPAPKITKIKISHG